MYWTLMALLGFAAVAGCGPGGRPDAPAAAATAAGQASDERMAAETARLNAWFEARYEEELEFHPILKTRIGRKDAYDEIDDLSEAAQDRELAWGRETVADLQQTFDDARLAPEGQASYHVWVSQRERAEAAAAFRRRGYRFHQMGGPHTDLPQFLITVHRVDDESDMVAYITRLGEVGRAVGQALERARLASAEGVHAPRFAYEAVIGQARAVVTGAPFPGEGDSPLWADAGAKIDALVASGEIDAERAGALRAQASAALVERVGPAYEALVAWAESELPLTDEVAAGVWRLPDGPAFYEERLAAMTTTDLTADEIHEIGLREVARIRTETDEGRQAYLDTARRHLDFIQARLPDYFGLLPKAALEVRRVEAFREVAGQAQHYQRGTPDGTRPGIYYAHLIDMGAMPIPLMEVIAYHEGLPGHHMQISIAQELTGLPTFRTLAGFTAFSEGWGLYAEWLAGSMGAYQDPYSDLGRLTSEIWRAVRLVVDTGLHAKRWTESQAVEYFTANSAVSEGQIRAEVRRYLVMPGQATAYKIGMLEIQELRARAEAAVGDAFDIREFHDTVLGGGALPLGLLERRVDDWIARTAP
jgi:uncharacterized protein (DUF885 family)